MRCVLYCYVLWCCVGSHQSVMFDHGQFFRVVSSVVLSKRSISRNIQKTTSGLVSSIAPMSIARVSDPGYEYEYRYRAAVRKEEKSNLLYVT
jgi:hypothetical protein